MDFNILLESNDEQYTRVKHLVQRAFDFGFKCIALNTVMDSSQFSGKKITIPDPKIIEFNIDTSKNFRILNRLTAVITDGMHIHHLLNSPVTKKYDIIALQPVGENMLRKMCDFDVDIVSLNLCEDLGFTIKKTHVGPLINKGKHFEITYAPCLRDQRMKRMTISNAQLLVEATKGKNVIISSGASNPLELRSVKDVQNLSFLFGLKGNEPSTAVQKAGELVLSHAGTRTKTGCGFVSITGLYNLPKHLGWIVKACKVPKSGALVASESSEKRLLEVESESENTVSKKIKIKK